MSTDGVRTWVEDPKLLAETFASRRREHDQRILMDQLLKRLYFDLPVAVDTGRRADRTGFVQQFTEYETLSQAGFNLSRQVIDASASTVVERLKLSVSPVGADFELERSCANMSAVVAGVMSAANYWNRLAPIAYRDGSNSSLGTILWYVDGATGEVKGDIVDSWNVLWSLAEGTEPLELLIERVVPRVGLKAQYPEHAAAIDKLPKYIEDSVPGVTHAGCHSSDTVRVVLVWRRKLGETAGKYVALALPDLVLDEKPWPFSFFPTAHYRYDWDAKGFGGYAGARVLVPYHMAMNKLLQKAYAGFDGASPTVLQNTLEPNQTFSTSAWRRIMWTTHKPDVIMPQAVSPQVLAEIERVESKAHVAFGMNEHAARGTRPQGLDSQPSQREWRDIKNERLSKQIENFSQLGRESARAIIALGSEAYKSKKVRTMAPGTSLLTEIKWPNLSEDKYQVEFEESSGLSDTLAGKKAEIGEFRDRGAISEGEYLRALGTPDLKATADRLSAPADLAGLMIEDALHEAKFTMPDRMQGAEGLTLLVSMGSRTYQRAKSQRQKYPRKNLECLRLLVAAAEARLSGMTAARPVMPVPAVLPGQPAGVAPMASAVLPPANPAPF